MFDQYHHKNRNVSSVPHNKFIQTSTSLRTHARALKHHAKTADSTFLIDTVLVKECMYMKLTPLDHKPAFFCCKPTGELLHQ